MRYKENVEDSIAFVKQVMPLMSKHPAPMNPVSFAVWYEYVAGINPELNAAVDRALAEKIVLDAATIESLHRQYIAITDEEILNRLPLDLQRIITDATKSVADTGTQVRNYDTSLQQFSQALTTEASAAPAGSDPTQSSLTGRIRNLFGTSTAEMQSQMPSSIERILNKTQQMRLSTTTLSERLADSRKEIETLRAEVIRVRRAAMEDGLTGLANRRSFDETVATLLYESNAGGPCPSLVLLDIDHFKKVNDTYGHLFGDKVIKAVAEMLKRNVKGQDFAARYGGEEFAVLLPKTPLEGARAVAEAIRVAVASCRIRRQDSEELCENFTISLGVATYIPGEQTQDFIARADKALYVSKSQGRNRVTAHGMDPIPRS